MAQELQHREVEQSMRQPIQYRPSLVSFIDILGFRELIRDYSAKEIASILSRLRDMSLPTDVDDGAGTMSVAQWRQVSDASVRVRHYDVSVYDAPLFDEIFDLCFAQINCLNRGIFIRGGLAIGNAYIDENQPAFGPAFVEAYDLESKVAKAPRIVVSSEVLSHFKIDKRLQAPKIYGHPKEKDNVTLSYIGKSGNVLFLDYLRMLSGNSDSWEKYMTFVEQHKQIILTQLNDRRLPRKVRRRYQWVAVYHNKHVRDKLTSCSGFLIDIPSLD